MTAVLSVLVQTPAHSGVAGALHYEHGHALPVGTLVRVPLGQRETLGVVVPGDATSPLPAGTPLRSVTTVLDGLAPLDTRWLELFALQPGFEGKSRSGWNLSLQRDFWCNAHRAAIGVEERRGARGPNEG